MVNVLWKYIRQIVNSLEAEAMGSDVVWSVALSGIQEHVDASYERAMWPLESVRHLIYVIRIHQDFA